MNGSLKDWKIPDFSDCLDVRSIFEVKDHNFNLSKCCGGIHSNRYIVIMYRSCFISVPSILCVVLIPFTRNKIYGFHHSRNGRVIDGHHIRVDQIGKKMEVCYIVLRILPNWARIFEADSHSASVNRESDIHPDSI